MNDRQPGAPTEGPAGDSSGRGAGYWVFALLVAVLGIALVIYLYDRGILPIAGPFALVALLPLLWPLYERGQRKKAERKARRAGRDPA